jgi:broad specificity phosphatase PhoE
VLEIIFESHATSIDNENGIASGWLDPPLSAKGLRQAQELKARYDHEPLGFIYTSDLARSYETATIAFGNTGVPILKESRLREWNYGVCNGSSNKEVEALKGNHVHVPFPSGESLEQVMQRFLSFKNELLQGAKSGSVLIIGHRAIYYALEFNFHHIPLKTLVTRPWTWQPGWRYNAAVT